MENPQSVRILHGSVCVYVCTYRMHRFHFDSYKCLPRHRLTGNAYRDTNTLLLNNTHSSPYHQAIRGPILDREGLVFLGQGQSALLSPIRQLMAG